MPTNKTMPTELNLGLLTIHYVEFFCPALFIVDARSEKYAMSVPDRMCVARSALLKTRKPETNIVFG